MLLKHIPKKDDLHYQFVVSLKPKLFLELMSFQNYQDQANRILHTQNYRYDLF